MKIKNEQVEKDKKKSEELRKKRLDNQVSVDCCIEQYCYCAIELIGLFILCYLNDSIKQRSI